METISIKKENLQKAYKEGTSEIKTLLENLFSEDVKPKLKWQDITNFNQVLEAAGEDVSEYEIPKNATKRQRGRILYSKLELICDIFKEGISLDYADENQYKYYPWGKYKAGSGFSLYVVHCAGTGTGVGARLCVDSEAKARHIWEHFNYIYQEFWQEK